MIFIQPNDSFFWIIFNIVFILTIKWNNAKETIENVFLPEIKVNGVISPFSIFSSLKPLKFGSEGKAYEELEDFLKGFEQKTLEQNNTDGISTVTVVYSSIDFQILPEFKDKLENASIQSIENFDFANYGLINEHVRNSTNGLIQNLVGPSTISKDTQLVIINCIHFSGTWRLPFQLTYRSIPFTLNDGTNVSIPMMYQKSSNYIGKAEKLDASVIEIPYKLSSKVLRIYLPNRYDGLQTLLEKLESFNQSSLKLKFSEVDLTLPMFRIETEVHVTPGLKQLGLNESLNNLTKISSNTFRVDEIISKSVIDVNLDGTEAGSSSAAFLIPLSGFVAEEFTVNRPFYFEVRDKETGTVFFSGIYRKPDSSQIVGPVEDVETLKIRTRLNKPLIHKNKDTIIPNLSEDLLPPPSVSENDNWWTIPEKPAYISEKISETDPRFQQPEPVYPSGIRFLVKDSNMESVIDSHLQNSSLNAIS